MTKAPKLLFLAAGSAAMCALCSPVAVARASASTTCRATVDSQPRNLTPELEVVAVIDTSSCPAAIRIAARGPDNALWATDNGNGIWRSPDNGRTWSLVYTAAGYLDTEHVLPLASGAALVVVEDANGVRHIVRIGPGGSSPVTVFDFPANAWLLGSQSWAETTAGIFIAEYGPNGLPDVDIWRSTDDGLHFARAFVIANGPGFGVRHFHSLQDDPYSPGTLWVTAGDTRFQPRIGYSTNGGSSFTWITQGVYPESRAVSLMFAPDAVYWATDNPDGPATIYRWGRSTHQISAVATGLNGPFYFTVSSRGLMATFSAVELPSNGYTGDQWVHVASSADGSSWSSAPFWMRMQEPGIIALPTGITTADSNGMFWLSYYGLDGTPDRTVNIELQLSPPNVRVTLGTAAVVSRAKRSLVVYIACPALVATGRCRGLVSASDPDAADPEELIARGHFSIEAHRTARVRLALGPHALSVLSGRLAQSVDLLAVTTDAQGRPATASETAHLLH